MAARKPTWVANGSAGVVPPQDARLAIAGQLSTYGPGPLDATGGVFYGPGNPCKVTGSSSGPTMKYLIAGGNLTTARGTSVDGLYPWANDGSVTVDSSTAAPASNSRWDLIWARAKNANDGFGDSNSDTEFGVLVGVAGSSPVKPYGAGQGAGGTSLPAGALVLAESNVRSTDANASTALITQVAPWKVARGARIPVRSAAERNALTTYDGLQVYRLDTHLVESYDGTAWSTQEKRRIGTFSGTISNGTSFKHNAVAVPFTPAFTTLPDQVVATITSDDNISVNVISFTLLGFSYRAFATGGTVNSDHNYAGSFFTIGGA